MLIHVVIDVLIASLACYAGKQKPWQVVRHTCQGGGLRAVALEQAEFLCPANSRTAVADPELRVDLIGVCTQSVQRYHQLTGNLWAAQLGSEQSEHVTLTDAQRLDQ